MTSTNAAFSAANNVSEMAGYGSAISGSNTTALTPEMFGFTAEFEKEFSEVLGIIESESVESKTTTAIEAMTPRQYLEQNIAPLLIDGLKSLNRDRPPNAAEYLAAYLLANSPQQPQMQVQHPLINHKMSLLRDKHTTPKQFRELVREISTILVIQSTMDLKLISKGSCESPMDTFETQQIAGNIGLFPIMRAGLGMVDEMIPAARTYHLGLYRESSTLLPVEYYNKLPAQCEINTGFVLDPMVATAGTAIAAVNILKDWGLKRIKFLCILASKDGLRALREAHPDIEIFVAAVDNELNDNGYVLPGLGDSGDRYFKTPHQ